MEIVVWLLSVQLWTDPPPKIKIMFTKEYATHEECMEAREYWVGRQFQALCLVKQKIKPPLVEKQSLLLNQHN